jgi:hypothetical protein
MNFVKITAAQADELSGFIYDCSPSGDMCRDAKTFVIMNFADGSSLVTAEGEEDGETTIWSYNL